MPLGVRDFLLILRAKDQASRVITDVGRSVHALGDSGKLTGAEVTRVGQTLLGVGAAVGAVGAAGVAFFTSATSAAKEYNQAAALTLTQTDLTADKLHVIKDIGKAVAAEVPAAFDQMQDSLFDIFSSMEVGPKQAQIILREFARGAVAGQTEVQVAGRATIALMNAFKVPAEDVTKVMDLQFQLVRKGVGTYEEFARAIGRSIPSAVKAGQTMESFAGALAFATRNGLSAAMASTSVGRAMDLLANPKFAGEMSKIGIATANAKGEFRPLVDVMADLKKHMDALTPFERADLMKSLTKGAGGTIQALRFVNLALDDQHGLLRTLTNDMSDAGGAMGKAYDIMAVQPQSQLQLLKNNWEILRVEIGDMFLPRVAELVSWGMKLIKWFRDLDPALQENIIRFAAIGSIIAVVAGAVLMLVGILAVAAGAIMTAFGVSLLGAIAIMAGIPLVIAGIAAAGFLLVKNWNTVKAFFEPFVNWLIEKFEFAKAGFILLSMAWQEIIEGSILGALIQLASYFDYILGTNGQIARTMMGIAQWFRDIWSAISGNIAEFTGTFREYFVGLFARVSDLANQFSEKLSAWWASFGPKFLADVRDLWQTLSENVQAIIVPLGEAIGHVFNAILFVVSIVMAGVTAVITIGLNIIGALWRVFGDNLLRIVEAVWNTIYEVVKGAMTFVLNIIKAVLHAINGDWGKAWDAIKDALGGAWDAIYGLLRGVVIVLANIIGTIIESITHPFREMWDVMYGFGKSIIEGLIKGVKSMVNTVKESVGDVVQAITGPIGSVFRFGSPSKYMIEKGRDIAAGLAIGMGMGDKLVSEASEFLASAATPPPVMATPTNQSNSLVIEEGAITIIVQGGNTNEETAEFIREAFVDVIRELTVK